jgi:hypothetical protein
MKQNQIVGPSIAGPQVNQTLDSLVSGLVGAVQQFNQENGPPLNERTVRLAFANGVYLAIRNPEALANLVPELCAAGVTGGQETEAVVAGFDGFECRDDWIAGAGDIVTGVWRSGGRGADDPVRLVLFAVFAGITVATQLPDVAKEFESRWGDLNSESRFLASRLIWWRGNDWKPEHAPFVEFAVGFYEPGSCELGLVAGGVRDVLSVARAFSDPWRLGLWAEAGWFAGQKVGATMPEQFAALINKLPDGTLANYAGLYRRTVLATAAPDGIVRPEAATLRYFGSTANDVYARTFCCGNQPRFIARAAYDFAFWMGMLSTRPIPRAHTERALA